MNVSPSEIKALREMTGAGIMDCCRALLEAGGDKDRATRILKEQGLARAESRRDRLTPEGLIEAYIHPGGRLGVLVEVNCETDFVARTDEFKELVHDIALQVAACSPQFIRPEDAPSSDSDPKEACLLLQPFIKDPTKTVEERVKQTIATLGENIVVRRFVRFALGE